MNRSEILKLAIKKNGIASQFDMVTEEVGELLTAMNKLRRQYGGDFYGVTEIHKPGKNNSVKYSRVYYNLCGEIADCKIMLEQLEKIMCSEAVKISEERKIDRLEKRLTQPT